MKQVLEQIYSAALHKLIEDVEAITEKYGGFVENVCVASRRYISRGCRRNYIPVYQRNQIACMKTTQNSMQATLLTTVL